MKGLDAPRGPAHGAQCLGGQHKEANSRIEEDEILLLTHIDYPERGRIQCVCVFSSPEYFQSTVLHGGKMFNNHVI